MKRREIFAGNWKMYKTSATARDLIISLKKDAVFRPEREVVVFPPSPYAMEMASLCKGSGISVGMQNMYFQNEGAFTGEVSPLMVKDCGCKYILIGHSERRHVFGESDTDVNKKVLIAYKTGIVPMICVGELLDEREKGRTEEVLKRQIREAFKDVDVRQAGEAVIAYEPVWAIGTGKVATPEIAEDAHRYIRGVVRELYGADTADIMPILYGGSVKPDNIAGLYAQEDIDGVLVGGASLEAKSFTSIINTQ